jgi:hypothetical protein
MVNAQVQDVKQLMQDREQKNLSDEEKDLVALAATEHLVNSQKFVFEADYGQESAEVFVLVDSLMGMVQRGMRNNQDGRITQFVVKKNLKKKTVSVTIKIRGNVGTADIFLLLGPEGHGSGSVRADSYTGDKFREKVLDESPGYYNFDGQLRPISQALIYKGKSHEYQ